MCVCVCVCAHQLVWLLEKSATMVLACVDRRRNIQMAEQATLFLRKTMNFQTFGSAAPPLLAIGRSCNFFIYIYISFWGGGGGRGTVDQGKGDMSIAPQNQPFGRSHLHNTPTQQGVVVAN